MPPITDLLDEKTLMDLSEPNDFIDGAAAAEHGSVRMLEQDEVHLRAEVEDTQIYEAGFSLEDEKLSWWCQCGQAAERLCRHLVATALTTWPDEVPDEVALD